jgi:hypothetical protein
MTTIRIPYNFEPRKYQLPLFRAFDEGKKRAVIVWHRRAGKDISLLNILLKGAIRRVGVYYYFFPTYQQGKKILWKGMTREGRRFLDYIPKALIRKKNETEMSIELMNGSIIQVVGTDNIDSIVGTNPVGCIFSEYSLQNPKAWTFMRPILAENGGWAIFNFTPRGKNHAYDLHEMAKNNDKWFVSCLTIKDTGVIKSEVIEEERASGMSEDMILQEYYCSYEAAIEGSYYARQIKFLEENDRIIDNIYDKNLKVHTAWDLGVADSTSIWFFQIYKNEIRIIDFYENSGEGLEHYIEVCKNKPYKYDKMIAPHDIKVREFTSGQSRIEVARQKGINFDIAPQLPVIDGIESVRRTLKRCWFDKTKTKEGLNCLRSYHKAYDEKKKVFKSRPEHDWSSHGSDAFRYLAVSLEDIEHKKTKTIDIL